MAGARVYLFTEAGSYLGRYEATDESGNAEFLIPERAYRFRVDYNGSRYWSDEINILPDEEVAVDLQLDLLALNLTNNPHPDRIDGTPPEIEQILLASLFDIQGLLSNAVVTATTSEQTFYYINDHLGTPQKIVDEAGAIVWKSSYMPFGVTNVGVTLQTNDFRFPGQYYDEETGVHYNYHRYYHGQTGRYLRADPVGLEGDVTLYRYAQSNPLRYADPFGLQMVNQVGPSLIHEPSLGAPGDSDVRPGLAQFEGTTYEQLWRFTLQHYQVQGASRLTKEYRLLAIEEEYKIQCEQPVEYNFCFVIDTFGVHGCCGPHLKRTLCGAK